MQEFGPTRIDETHRIVISGVVDLPFGFQLAPILQHASARPYSPTTGVDIDGDGLATNDRLCAGVDPLTVLQAVRGRNPTTAPSDVVRSLNPRGCTQTRVNSQRDGYVVDANGNITKRDGRFFNVDLLVSVLLSKAKRNLNQKASSRKSLMPFFMNWNLRQFQKQLQAGFR